MARMLKMIDEYRNGNIDVYTVKRAIDVSMMSGDIDQEEYMTCWIWWTNDCWFD